MNLELPDGAIGGPPSPSKGGSYGSSQLLQTPKSIDSKEAPSSPTDSAALSRGKLFRRGSWDAQESPTAANAAAAGRPRLSRRASLDSKDGKEAAGLSVEPAEPTDMLDATLLLKRQRRRASVDVPPQEILSDIKRALDQSRIAVVDFLRKLDAHGAGMVSAAELRRGLAGIGYKLASEKQFAVLMSLLDKDCTGRVVLKEFQQGLTLAEKMQSVLAAAPVFGTVSLEQPTTTLVDDFGAMSPTGMLSEATRRRLRNAKEAGLAPSKEKQRGPCRSTEADSVLMDIKAQLDATKTRSIDLFRLVDTSRDGRISFEELRTALALKGYRISDEDLNMLVESLDADRSGEVDLKEFDRGLRRAERLSQRRRSRSYSPTSLLGGDDEEETVTKLLLQLDRQHDGLRRELEKEQRSTAAKQLQAERLDRSRFDPYHSPPWRRPTIYAREMSAQGSLPRVYLDPVDASKPGRPARNYEKQTGVPFLHTLTPHADFLDKNAQAPFHTQVRPQEDEAWRSHKRSDCTQPRFSLPGPGADPNEFALSPRPYRADCLVSPRIPRSARGVVHPEDGPPPTFRYTSAIAKPQRLPRLEERLMPQTAR
eukprot:TRINITY_DN62141_c0_g1_i1.p1 TRINITY_DN62141_c0_g1~~TRINITY_DN62141_c0_g1_i1.p1  ORF type:complete len:595 (+),score=142.84 TRINITY_DN62141_c0_g1_i1:75-1859(+)